MLGAGATAMAVSAFRLSDYVESLRFAQVELHIKRFLRDEIGEAQALNGIGWGYDKMGLYQQALTHHFRSLRTLERVAPELTADPLNGIAAAYLDVGRPERAVEYGQLAFKAAGQSQARLRERSTALRLIGLGYSAAGDHELADLHFRRAIEASDPYGKSLTLLSLGDLQLARGDYGAALRSYGDALTIQRSSNSRRATSAALVGVGNAHLQMGAPEAALGPLSEALAKGEASRAPVEMAAAHLGLSRALKALGRFDEALEHFEAFHAQNEKVLRQTADLRTQLLTIQFDVERIQKDREIDRLRNVELARAFTDLREMHERLERQAAKLERLSLTDDLTSLHNRRAFEERLADEVARARRTNRPLSVLMIDLDDFKLVNDVHSHAAGDAVLKATAQALLACVRDVDTCARIGGEEFIVLLPETDLVGATTVAEKVVLLVHERNLYDSGVNVTASAGVATLITAETPGELVSRADAALYRAKREGKNRVMA
jgi:diguanylate cyclase (GGDEF)-like protein